MVAAVFRGVGLVKGSWRWPWSKGVDLPDPATFAPATILLASEGRLIADSATDFAAQMAKKSGAPVHVLSIARVWGSALGLPHPGLMPTKREWKTQHDLVADAVARLKRRGIEATGQVLGTRNAAKRIVAEAQRRRSATIVMSADAPRHWLVGDLFWSQDPYRVRRLSPVPVYLIVAQDRAD
jgi:nucleotide-binding universal stress UspA family protein